MSRSKKIVSFHAPLSWERTARLVTPEAILHPFRWRPFSVPVPTKESATTAGAAGRHAEAVELFAAEQDMAVASPQGQWAVHRQPADDASVGERVLAKTGRANRKELALLANAIKR